MWRFFRGDFLIYTTAKILVGLSSFALLHFLTHAMTPAKYANYSLVFAIVTLLTTVITSWQTNSVVRFLPIAVERNRQQAFNHAFAQIGAVTAALSAIAAAMVLAVASEIEFIHLSPISFAAAVIAGAAGSVFQIYSIYSYSGRRRVSYSVLLILQICLLMVGAATIPYITIDPVELTLLFLAGSFVLPLVLFRMPTPRIPFRRLENSKTIAKQFLQYGGPLVLLNFAVQLNTYLDQFVLRAMTDLHQVGLYAANYVVADKVVYAFSSVITVALGPLIFREWEQGKRTSSYQMIWKSIFVFVIITCPVLIVMLTIPDAVMSVIAEPQYAPGRVIIPFVMTAALFSGIASIVTYVHTLLLRTAELTAIYVIGTALRFGLDLLLIPKFGLLGCAFATTVSGAALLLMLVVRAQGLCGFVSYFPAALGSSLRGSIGVSKQK
jgi:O-antigen/teichoic acid export membrane protein